MHHLHLLTLITKNRLSPYDAPGSVALHFDRSLDSERKDELIDCIEILLGDDRTLVLGSAIAAFNEVCPERLDIIHPHFRKLCNMLADTDEWGQIYILQLLTRYARLQFANPNADHPVKAKRKAQFYSDDESGSSDDGDDYIVEPGEVDPDHQMLLRAALPLLQSRNTGVCY
jgi:AP-3 complex subunit beta